TAFPARFCRSRVTRSDSSVVSATFGGSLPSLAARSAASMYDSRYGRPGSGSRVSPFDSLTLAILALESTNRLNLPLQIQAPAGNRSEMTTSSVGQKNVLPTPYTVTAAIHGQTESTTGLPSMYSPIVPSDALQKSSPTGLIFSTIGPAKNRRVNISTFVQMNA